MILSSGCGVCTGLVTYAAIKTPATWQHTILPCVPALAMGISKVCTHIALQTRKASFKMLLQGMMVKKKKKLHLEFVITANSYHSDCNNKVMLGLML